MVVSRRRSRLATYGLLVLSGCWSAGCDSLGNRKFENPVAGPPPKRFRAEQPAGEEQTASAASSNKQKSDVAQVSYDPESGSQAVPGGDVAAVVNGQPIFIEDILDAMPPEATEQLAAIKRQSTPEEYERHRRMAARMAMRPVIERTILVQALEELEKPEKFKALLAVMDKEFEKYLDKIMVQMNVATRSEMKIKLQEQGTSLVSLKQAFVNDQMARYYLYQKSPEPKKPDRQQLLAYYEAHVADYTYVGQVRWQQIVLSYEEHGGPQKTRALANDLSQKLLEGSDFAELAKQYSSGPTAAEGGTWDWTRQGGLASKETEKQLFSLQVGSVSTPIVRPDSVEIVRVLERKEAGRKPFESLQHEIEKAIVEDAKKKATSELMKSLVAQAEITVLIEDVRE